MTPSLQATWSWMRMCQGQLQSPGLPLQMRRKTIGCTTWSPSMILLSILGKSWLTTSLITSSLPLTSCQQDSINSVSMPRMTWGFPNPLIQQPGK